MDESGVRVVRILQPTYDVEPELDNRFTKNRVEEACTPVVSEFLRNKHWSEAKDRNTELSAAVTGLVMDEVRKLGFSRYKVIVQTNLGENRSQTVRVASQCLWEPSLDAAAEVNFVSDRLFCTVVILGMYVH
jgi:hypothetical protein